MDSGVGVLVIDNVVERQLATARRLLAAGIAVVCAPDGWPIETGMDFCEAAIVRCTNEPLGDLLRGCYRTGAKTPVIVLSDHQLVPERLRAPPFAWLVGPVSDEELIRTVKRARSWRVQQKALGPLARCRIDGLSDPKDDLLRRLATIMSGNGLSLLVNRTGNLGGRVN